MSGSRVIGGSRRWVSCAVILPILLIAPVFAGAAPFTTTHVINPTTGQMVEAVDGEILVVPRAGATAQQVRDLCHQMNAVWGKPLIHGAVWAIKLPAGQSVSSALAAYGGSPAVAYAEPAVVFVEHVVPNDPNWTDLWGLGAGRPDRRHRDH